MSDCIFCKIANKEIPTEMVYEDEYVAAFKDLNPQTPIHVLIIPKKHVETVVDLTEEDELVVGKMFTAARKIAKKYDIEEKGFRLIVNCKEDAGQEVMHLHMHFLAGQKLGTKII